MANAPRAPHVTITLTEEIIKESTQRDSKNCMVAETIAATVPNASNVVVDAATIRWSDLDKGLRYVYITPNVVRDSILRFDLGMDIEPYAFVLRKAWVTGIRGSGDKRMSISDWEATKEKIKKAREDRGISWGEVADEMGLNIATVNSKFSPGVPMPGVANMDIMEAWLTKQTGEPPAPRVKTHTHKVEGPARPRKSSTPGEVELIGGHPPKAQPAIATKRKFGLRMFDWDEEVKAKIRGG
jgi:hypothetical protein